MVPRREEAGGEGWGAVRVRQRKVSDWVRELLYSLQTIDNLRLSDTLNDKVMLLLLGLLIFFFQMLCWRAWWIIS